MDNQLPLKAYGLIKKAQQILLVTHDRPDGDGLSSVCLLAELLETLNKPYQIYCYDLPHHHFNFLPHLEKFSNQLVAFNFDLTVALDCAGLKRTNLTQQISQRKKNQMIIEFDHHPRLESYADLEIRDPQAASTTEILYHFLKVNKIKINKKMAICILTGILTDTGNFLYPATSSETVNIAAEMLTFGARLPQIMEHTWRNKSVATMKIWGKALSNLYLNPKYNFAVSVLTQSDISKEVSDEGMEGIAGFLSNLHNVKGLLLLREQKDGVLRGNLRTVLPNIDLAKLALLLGGGGHAKASGFTLEGKLEKTDRGWRVV